MRPKPAGEPCRAFRYVSAVRVDKADTDARSTVAVDLEGEAFRLASSSIDWTSSRDSPLLKKLLDAVQPSSRPYVQALRGEIAKYVSFHDERIEVWLNTLPPSAPSMMHS